MVPPGAEISSLEKLLKPFESLVWVCFSITLLGAFLIVGVLKLSPKQLREYIIGRGTRDPSLNILNITFGGSLNKLPTTNLARFVLMTFMIYCFIITNSYKGALLNFMRKTTRENEVKSTDEIIARGFKLFMLESSKAYLTEMPQIKSRAVFVSPEEYKNKLDEVIVPGFKGAVLTSKDHLAYRNIQSFPNRYYSHAPQVLFGNNLVIYMTKNTCLAYQFDQNINNLNSGGLIEIWATRFIDKNFLKRQPSNRSRALQLTHLFGAFQLLLGGLIISFSVFLLEVCHKLAEVALQRDFAAKILRKLSNEKI